MNSAPSDPSTGAQGAASPAGEPAGGMPSAFANGLPGTGGSSAPASPTPPASAGTPQAGESPAGASPDTPEPQADPFAQRLREHEVSQRLDKVRSILHSETAPDGYTESKEQNG